ncbi:MAG: bifunctional hydroxymethylpyrimidine kinase/phosphomethylpyrimidine kinase [Actinomycetota bacterium]
MKASETPPVVLAIAAHDPLGGAGLAADLTTFAALGVHGTVAVTAVTAQHLDHVDRVEPVPTDLVAAQIDAIVESFPIAAVKTGLLGSAAIVDLVADRVASGALPAPVVDPVLVDGRGNRFVGSDIERAYRERLFPSAAMLTPNLGEAAVLAGRPLDGADAVSSVAAELAGLGAGSVVVTGGDDPDALAVDVVVDRAGALTRLTGRWVDTPHVRGSGCTFAAATAAGLAAGRDPVDAAREAKAFVAARLEASTWPGLDSVGPVSHRFGPIRPD